MIIHQRPSRGPATVRMTITLREQCDSVSSAEREADAIKRTLQTVRERAFADEVGVVGNEFPCSASGLAALGSRLITNFGVGVVAVKSLTVNIGVTGCAPSAGWVWVCGLRGRRWS